MTFSLVKSLPPTLTVWNGAYDTLWNNPNNWNNGLPSSNTSAVVPNISILPTVNDSEAVHNLNIYNTASIYNLGNLNVWDSINNNGLIYGNGLVSLVGTSSQLVLGNGTISNLTLNNTHGASIASGNNSLNITGTLNLLLGTLNTNGNLILRSSGLATASITPIQSGAGITGNITVQRHIPAKAARKYSFVSSPVSQQINSAWQQQIFITGSGSGGQVCGAANSNGFDATLNNTPSFFKYNPVKVNGSRWVSIPNTNTTNLTPGIGYKVNIRGSRMNGGGCNNQLNAANPASPDAVVLSATGAYNVSPTATVYGTTSYGTTTSAYTLLGNPYPAALSATAFLNTNSSVVTNNMWLYANNGNTAGSYGSWNRLNKTSTGYWPNDYTTDNATDLVIPSGSAFFVERTAAADASVSFNELHKMSSPKSSISIFGTANDTWNDKIRITLTNADSAFIDDAVVLIGSDPNISDTSYTDFDTYSFNTANAQYITSIKAGLPLSVNTIKTTLLSDSVHLNVHSSATGNFQLRFGEYELFDENISIKLWDKFLNKMVDVKANPIYGFTISADSNTEGSSRFELLFIKTNTLAMNQISLKAIKENGGIELAWQTSLSESGKFIVEASNDGQQFNTIGTSTGIDSLSRYTFMVNKKVTENSYYRIKDIDKTGRVFYSNTVLVKDNTLETSIAVYPNPLTGKVFSVYLKGIVAGNYTVVLYDMIGKKVEQLPLIHGGSNRNYILMLQNNLAVGIYKIIIENTNSGEDVAQCLVIIQ